MSSPLIPYNTRCNSPRMKIMKIIKIFLLSNILWLTGCTSLSEYQEKGYPVHSVTLVIAGLGSDSTSYFHKTVRKYINSEAGFPLIAPEGEDKSVDEEPEFTLFINLSYDKEFAFTQYSGKTNQWGKTTGRSWDAYYYYYRYELSLSRGDNEANMYTKNRSRVTGYTNYKKSRKWTSKRIAYDLKEDGMLNPSVYKSVTE